MEFVLTLVPVIQEHVHLEQHALTITVAPQATILILVLKLVIVDPDFVLTELVHVLREIMEIVVFLRQIVLLAYV